MCASREFQLYGAETDKARDEKVSFGLFYTAVLPHVLYVCPNSTRRARPDFAGDHPGLRPTSLTKTVGSAQASDKSVDFVWSGLVRSVFV